jgi:ABC-2 type transport system permease protein
MTTIAYTRFELFRTLRNRRLFLLSLGFPLGLYFLVAAPTRDVADLAGTGIPAPLYFMVGLATFGTTAAMLSTGARIAGDRVAGWTRQLRLTPLPDRSYLATKVVTAYLMTLLVLVLHYLAGVLLGVRLPAIAWLHVTALMLVGLIPFAALGILLGHVLSVEAIGPAMGGLTALLAFISGTWFPLGHGALADIARYVPSYWLVQASRVALGGDAWPLAGWLVVAIWSVALIALAGYAYRKDTERG